MNAIKDDPEEPSQDQEESGVELFRSEYLETVKLMKWDYPDPMEWEEHDRLHHQVIKNLHAYIKKIGQIIYY